MGPLLALSLSSSGLDKSSAVYPEHSDRHLRSSIAGSDQQHLAGPGSIIKSVLQGVEAVGSASEVVAGWSGHPRDEVAI
ncbi:hypothetical protein ETB97_000755 [Aspergillus alliaceus]|uniref:Uncharacterized protein n=1 Tax=Petromyces alliaceus TaxID=209559 RepID=A0A8H6A5P0_PETAA|nr:hypothetical protein ETB97_000755 [Aspergillus burnettii]